MTIAETQPESKQVPDDYLLNYDGFGKDWISTSSLALLMECGIAFEFKYINGVSESRNVRLCTGSATHSAREHNLKQKIESGTDCPVEEVTDAARDAINQAWASAEIRVEKEWEGKSTDDARGIAVDLAVEMATTDREVFQPEIQPAAVEETIAISYPDLPRVIVGKLDVREDPDADDDEEVAGIIRDLKTGKRAFGQSNADKEMGLTTYGLLRKVTTGERPDKYRIDNVVATGKTPAKTHGFETVRTERQLQQQLQRFALAMELIQKGAFMCCNPKHYRCNANYCGYHHRCPYAA